MHQLIVADFVLIAPDDSLNAIPLDGNENNGNADDIQGILGNGGNDFAVPAEDFPVQNNQESSGIDIPDLNSKQLIYLLVK